MISNDGFQMIKCHRIDRDLVDMDASGYWFLIKLNFDQGFIEVAVCHKKSEKTKNIIEIYYGRSCQDIYTKIFEVYSDGMSLDHAAYLGKELKKAEIALALGIRDQYQE